MELPAAVAFARTTSRSVLTTVRSNGRPQLSNVTHGLTDAGDVLISITATRAKHANLVREPWCALHVTSDDFWSWAVLEGTAELSPPAAAEDDATVAALVDYYRELRGEHPDWDEYRRVMVAEQRVLLRIRPGRAYGQLPG